MFIQQRLLVDKMNTKGMLVMVCDKYYVLVLIHGLEAHLVSQEDPEEDLNLLPQSSSERQHLRIK